MNVPAADEVLRIHDAGIEESAPAELFAAPRRTPSECDSLREAIEYEHRANNRLWLLEDEARSSSATDETIARVKRAIDSWNQSRNDWIERIDELALSQLSCGADAALNSETFGMIVDRLSILALKVRFNGAYEAKALAERDAALAEECAGRVALLLEQREDLAGCLDRLVSDCAAGRRRFKVYRQLKAYNDARLNPAMRR